MDAASSPFSLDPIAIVRRLDPDAIRARLEISDREREALQVLLSAAQRAHPCGKAGKRKEGRTHAQ